MIGLRSALRDRTDVTSQTRTGGRKHKRFWALDPSRLLTGIPLPLTLSRHVAQALLFGDEDSTVSVEGSRRWVARMRELGMQHVYVEVPGGDHSLFVRENPETLSKVFSFFNIVGKDKKGPRQ